MKKAVRLYNLLLRFYPASYRKAFGSQMRQTFLDQYNDVAEFEGKVGTSFWFTIITDEIQNIVRQQVNSLGEKNNFLTFTIEKALVSILFMLPLYFIFLVLTVKTALTIPHPSISGIAVILAFLLLLIAIPVTLSATASYIISCIFFNFYTKK